MSAPLLISCSLACIAVSAGTVIANPALDDSGGGAATPAVVAKPTEVEWGVGVRVRGIFIPKAEIELFVERAGDNGSRTLGLGLEFIRRRGNTELQLGLEFEGFNPGEGVWIESGKNVALGDAADVVLKRSDQPKPLGWVTLEFTFVNHAPLTKNLAIRYGGGAGIGIIKGELRHYDIACGAGATNDNPAPACEPPVPPFNGTGAFEGGNSTPVKYKLPPVFPVVNAIIGLQFKPLEKLTINLEGGIRTVLFFGMSSAYFF